MQVQIALLTSKIVIVPDRVARMPQVLGDCPLRLTTAQAIYDVRYAVQVESLHFCPPHLSTTHVESKGLLMAATHVSKVVQFTRPRVVHIGRPWVVHTARPRPVQTTRPSLVQYSPAGDKKGFYGRREVPCGRQEDFSARQSKQYGRPGICTHGAETRVQRAIPGLGRGETRKKQRPVARNCHRVFGQDRGKVFPVPTTHAPSVYFDCHGSSDTHGNPIIAPAFKAERGSTCPEASRCSLSPPAGKECSVPRILPCSCPHSTI